METNIIKKRSVLLIINGVYIASLDAKDIILAKANDKKNGYSLTKGNGEINYHRFINVFDYSLELIKLREVYLKTYRNNRMTWFNGEKEYTKTIINVTFKYAVYEYNRANPNTYVKYGYALRDLEFEDDVCIKDGELVGIKVGTEIHSPIADSLLGNNFCFVKHEGEIFGTYEAKKNMKPIYTSSETRKDLYKNGFYCDGVHYVRFKRSSGSARVGKCLFIDKRLYARMHYWEKCGITVRKGQKIDLAAWESYISLTSSSIIGTLDIKPENILVIDDYESVFDDDVMATRSIDNRLVTKEERVTISNKIWDGESLIECDSMGEYSCYGMVLLRNRFFKSCCFNSNLQKWFADNNITEISQLNGYTRAKRIEDIKLITTPSSIKYLKFGSLEQWLDNIDSTFGVVKHDKPTHYFNGELVQLHYQLINTLQLSENEVRDLLRESLEYVDLLKTDIAVMRHYLKMEMDDDVSYGCSPILNKNNLVFKMLEINDDFANTKIYNDFKKELVKSYIKNLRCGHILVHGNYSTLLGNPVEMLQSAIGTFDGISQIGVGNVHCSKFEYGRTILGSRSPHVTMGNVWLTNNCVNEEIDKYFNLTNEICCINSINENVLNRLSGSDFDSDTAMMTDNQILIEAAKRNYHIFKVPTGMVSADKVNRYFTDEQKSDLDIKTSVNKIGEIINFSQMLNSLYWDNIANGQTHEENIDLYCDISQLDVMSNLEIDKAKKIFTTDNAVELRIMKEKYKDMFIDEEGKDIKPNFFIHLARKKGFYVAGEKNYKKHKTSMDYLQRVINQYNTRRTFKKGFTPLSNILDDSKYDYHKINCRQINRVIDLIKYQKDSIVKIYMAPEEEIDGSTKHMIAQDIKLAVITELSRLKFSYSTAYRLMKLVEDQDYTNIRSSILFTLLGIPNKTFFDVFENSKRKISYLEEDSTGNTLLYGIKFTKLYKKMI